MEIPERATEANLVNEETEARERKKRFERWSEKGEGW
jgi:hypothetical protein